MPVRWLLVTAAGATAERASRREDGEERNEPRRRAMNTSERMRAVAVTPLWLMCAGTWGVTSAAMLTWSAVRDMPWMER